jgi:YVTN family beta-propeller protein
MKLFKRLLVAAAMLSIMHGAHAGPFLYVPTHKAISNVSVLSVFDTATDTRTGEAVVRGSESGSLVVRGVEFSPDGSRIYAASPTAITVINAADNQVVTQVDLNGIQGTRALLMNPAGTLLYVRTSTGVRTIDTTTNTVAGASDLFEVDDQVAFNPAGTLLYRVSGAGNLMETVDTASHAIVATTLVGDGNREIAINPAGTRVYVLSGNPSNAATVIDTATNTVIAKIPVGNFPTRMVINATGTRVYVSLFQELASLQGYVTVIDTATNTVIDTIPAGEQVASLAISPAGNRLYVQSRAGDGENVIGVIDTGCNSALGKISQATIGGYFQDLYMAPASGAAPPVAGAERVQITGIEVTQGIQDLANSVMLIGGRRTFVRVYVKSDGPAVPGVTAILSAVGNIFCIPGKTCPPSGSSLVPLVPVNAVGTRITVGPNPKRYNVDDSFVFELPWEWTHYQSLHLHAVVSQGPGLVPTQSCRNDVLNAPLYQFESGYETLKVQFVRLSYTLPGTFNGKTDALMETSENEQRRSESFIRRTYPLSDLLLAPDYPLFDGALGFAVARIPAACIATPADALNMCAHNYISARLAMLQATTGFMGDADAIYGLIPQVPNDKDRVFFTRGACCTNAVAAGPSTSNDYAAHELGHFLGRQHPVEAAARCEHSASDPDYPYFNAWIAPPFPDVATSMAGFDGGEPNLLIPKSLKPTIVYGPGTVGHFDVMSYCKPSWISDYTYKKLHICLGALHGLPGITPGCGTAGGQGGPGTPQLGDWLTVFGDITPAHAANFIARRVDRNYSPPHSVSGSHRIRLTGAGGVTLAEYPFTPDEVADAEAPGSNSAPQSFGQVVPFVAATQAIQIVEVTGSTVIGQKAVSPNAPVVSGVALQGSPDPAGLVTIAWNASDADSDPLTYDIFFTRDLGASLHPLQLGVTEKSAQVDTTRLAGGSAQFRVVATDGVQSAFADTPVFTLTNKPPKPRIASPGDGATIHVGQLINMEGAATDPQDGVIPGAGLTWSIAGRSLGSGSRLSITDLPVGLNQLSLTATNSVGLSATYTATVTVTANVDQPGPTLTAGPMEIGWHLGTGESDLQTAPLQIGNSGSGNLEFAAVSSVPWLTLSPTTGTAPAIITLTADPAGFGGGTTTDATVTLTTVGSPSQVIEIPVTLSVGNTFVVARTPATVAAPPPAPADFAFAASISLGAINAGQSVQTALTVDPSNGFQGTVSLSCSGLPASAACSFAPASLTVDAAAVTSTLTIATTTRTAMNSERGPINPLIPGGVLLAALGAPLGFRRRRTNTWERHFVLAALLFTSALALHGCSSGGQPAPGGNPGGGSAGTPAGTYSVTITATSGSTTHTAFYALTVN